MLKLSVSDGNVMGINIRSTEKEPYARWIVRGLKIIETRNSPSLAPYVGKRVGIIETGTKPAKLIGYVTITKMISYENSDDFYKDYDNHLVGHESQYSFENSSTGYKVGFVLENPQEIEPVPIYTRGIVSRRIDL